MEEEIDNPIENTEENTEDTSVESIEDLRASAESLDEPEVTPEEGVEEPSVDAPPAYEPSFKYKAFKETHDVPEEYRALYTSPESEELVNKLLSKSHAFDQVVEARDRFKESYSTIESQYNELNRDASLVLGAIEKKDFDTAFEALGVSDQDLINFALHKSELRDLPEHKRAEYNKQQELRREHLAQQRQFQDLEAQNQSYRTQLEQVQANTVSQDLQNTLATPAAQEFAQEFQKRQQALGSNQTLEETMRTMGTQIYNSENGRVAAGSELLNKIMAMYGYVPGAQPQAQQEQPQVPTTKKELPVIPKAGASNTTSPVTKSFKSIAEMRAHVSRS